MVIILLVRSLYYSLPFLLLGGYLYLSAIPKERVMNKIDKVDFLGISVIGLIIYTTCRFIRVIDPIPQWSLGNPIFGFWITYFFFMAVVILLFAFFLLAGSIIKLIKKCFKKETRKNKREKKKK